MKNLTFTVIIMLTCFFLSCSDDDKVVIGDSGFGTFSSLEFYDLATGKLIGSDETSEVTLSFSGKDASVIFDYFNEPLTGGTTVDGMIDLYFNPPVPPSETQPISFVVHASCEGYMPVDLPIEIFKKGLTLKKIPMVSYSNLPEGIVSGHFENYGTTNGAGELQSDVVLKTPDGSVTFTMPKGIKGRDASGNAVTGTISARINYFSPLSQNAQLAFPGGFDVQVKKNGNEDKGIFITAGMYTFSFENEKGDLIKTFDNGSINMQMALQPDGINPETGLPFKAGDSIDFWGFDAENAKWIFLERLQVQGALKSKSITDINVLWITFNFTFYDRIPISGCNPDVFILREAESCFSQVLIDLESDKTLQNYFIGVKVDVNYNNDFQSQSKVVSVGNDQILIVDGYRPIGSSGTITLFNPIGGCSYLIDYGNAVSVNIDDFCSNEVKMMNINFISDFEPVKMKVLLHCPGDSSLYFEPNIIGRYRFLNSDCWITVPITKGEMDVYLIPGKSYVVGTIIDGRFETWQIETKKEGDNFVILHNSDMTEDGSTSVIFQPGQERYVSYILPLTERSCEKMNF